ncbi:MAG TPA: tol-pal system protein YbgF [Verrucomicrobiae bacterium]|jgi:tol-pal system protein YbgF|nr:tol-pal system protein YbgF [Verrucomicrobiae bacterium]
MKRFNFLILLVAVSLPACYIPEQIDTLEREQKTLRSQSSASRSELEDIRSNVADMRANLDQMHREMKALQEKIEEVRYQVDRRIGQVGQSSREGDQRLKDLEARVAKLSDEFKTATADLKARDEELRKLKDTAQESRASNEAKEKAAAESASAKRDYDDAMRLVERKDYRAAMPRLREFLKKYPDSNLAENAQYWLGECYYAVKEYDQAILEFDGVRRRFPKGDKVPTALLRQGFAFAELGDKLDARLILQELVERFPESEEAGKAKQRLKSLDSPSTRTAPPAGR